MIRIVKLDNKSAFLIGATMGLLLAAFIGIVGIVILFTAFLNRNEFFTFSNYPTFYQDTLLFLTAGIAAGGLAGGIFGMVYNLVASFYGGLRLEIVFEDNKAKRGLEPEES